MVWIVQLVELGMFYYFPERYEEIMAHELEEVQRLYLLTSTKVQIPTGKCVCEAGVETENFCYIDSSLPDDGGNIIYFFCRRGDATSFTTSIRVCQMTIISRSLVR